MRVTHLFIYLILSFFFGCFVSDDPDKTAGGEDFPNSIGPLVAQNIDDHASWTSIDSISKSDSYILPSSLTGNTSLQKQTANTSGPGQLPAPVLQLAKANAKSDTNIVVSGDTITIFITTPRLLSTRFDTLIFRALDEHDTVGLKISSRETLNSNGTIIHQHILEDFDGDGIITARQGQTNRARLYNDTLKLLTREKTEMIIDAGPDEHFGDDTNKDKEADNLIVSFAALKLSKEGDTLSYAYWEDGDGDGIITPDAKNDINTAIMVEYTDILGLGTYKHIVVEAGKDKHFGDDDNKDKEADNLLVSLYEAIISAKGDTLKTTLVQPDNPIIYSGNAEDSVIVQFKEATYLKDAILLPSRVLAESKMVIWPSDSTKNYALNWREEKYWDNGRTEYTTIKGDNADGLIRIGDTVIVAKEIHPAPTSAVSSRTATFKAGLGEDINSENDDVFYGFTATENRRTGPIRLTNFTLIPDEPLGKDENLKIGVVLATFVSESGDSWIIEGRLDGENITITFTGPKSSGEVVLDMNGNKVE